MGSRIGRTLIPISESVQHDSQPVVASYPMLRRSITLIIVIFCCMIFVAAVLSVGIPAQQDDDPPGVPAAYYGTIMVNGGPGSAGLTIEAEIAGEVRGSITTDKGEYGGPNPDEQKLVVNGQIGENGSATVEFYVNGNRFSRTKANTSVTWISGQVRKVNLGVSVSRSSRSDSQRGTPEGSELVEGDEEQLIEYEETAPIVVNEETGRAEVRFGDRSSVESISFDSDAVSGDVTVRHLTSEPAKTGSSPGQTTSVVEIIVPEAAVDQSATVRFRESKSRLDQIGATASELRIYRYLRGEWRGQPTSVIEETNDRVVLEGRVSGFSLFSVGAVSEPEAIIEIQPNPVFVGELIEFSASKSSDRYGEIISYEWEIAGRSFEGELVSAVLRHAGQYNVSLLVTNNAGNSDNATAIVTVRENQTPTRVKETSGSPTTVRGDSSPASELTPPDGQQETTESAGDDSGSPWIGLGIAIIVLLLIILLERRQ